MATSNLYEVMGHHLDLVPTNVERVHAIAVPPPDFDPARADTKTLLRYGIQPRPDAKKMPDAARTWDRLTALPYKSIVPTLREIPQKRMRVRPPRRPADTSTVYSQNWSGGLIFNPDTSGNDPLQQISGQWVVPSVAPPVSGDGFWASLTWVGIDGDNSSDVMQIGTAQFVSTTNGVVSTNYFAWIEWYTYNWMQVSLSVNPGDTIFCSIQNYGMQDGVFQAGGRITNVTQGTTTAPVVSAPPGTNFIGNVGEWIMERPAFSSLATLPRYGEVIITDTTLCSKGGNYYSANQPVNMTSDGSSTGTLYASGGVGPASSSWVASS